MKTLFLVMFCSFALGMVGYACTVNDGGGDTDGGTDSDGGTDTDTDNHVDCTGIPTSCEDIGHDAATQYFGCCFDNIVYFCVDGALENTDCEDDTCSYSAQEDAMWCI